MEEDVLQSNGEKAATISDSFDKGAQQGGAPDSPRTAMVLDDHTRARHKVVLKFMGSAVVSFESTSTSRPTLLTAIECTDTKHGNMIRVPLRHFALLDKSILFIRVYAH